MKWDCHLHVFDAELPTLGGHYAPQTARLEQVQTLAKPHGIERFVLVQPSVYGRDNSLLLRALQQNPGRHRGVAVVDESVTPTQLQQMHALGVRGIRFNRVSPVGRHPDPAATLRVLGPELHRLAWHVQWFVKEQDVPLLPALQKESGLPFVLDHLGHVSAETLADAPAWEALEALGRSGQCWIKLSAWYRLHAQEPYEMLDPLVARLLPWFSSGQQLRLVWGSDWPHTGIAPANLPDYGQLLSPLKRVLTAAQCEQVLSHSPQFLYG